MYALLPQIYFTGYMSRLFCFQFVAKGIAVRDMQTKTFTRLKGSPRSRNVYT